MSDKLENMSRDELLAECRRLKRDLLINEWFTGNVERSMRRERVKFGRDYKWIADFSWELLNHEYNGFIKLNDSLSTKFSKLKDFAHHAYWRSDALDLDGYQERVRQSDAEFMADIEKELDSEQGGEHHGE